jgi:hypothetical protein
MVIWMGISRSEKLLPKKVGKILDFPAKPVIIGGRENRPRGGRADGSSGPRESPYFSCVRFLCRSVRRPHRRMPLYPAVNGGATAFFVCFLTGALRPKTVKKMFRYGQKARG